MVTRGEAFKRKEFFRGCFATADPVVWFCVVRP